METRDFHFYLERAQWMLELGYVLDRDLYSLAHELMVKEQPESAHDSAAVA